MKSINGFLTSAMVTYRSSPSYLGAVMAYIVTYRSSPPLQFVSTMPFEESVFKNNFTSSRSSGPNPSLIPFWMSSTSFSPLPLQSFFSCACPSEPISAGVFLRFTIILALIVFTIITTFDFPCYRRWYRL